MGTGRGTLREVRDKKGDFRVSQGRVGGTTGRSVTGRWALGEVRDG